MKKQEKVWGKSELPVEFQIKMKHLLGEEYENFLNSYENNRSQGLRVNTRKVQSEDELELLKRRFELTKVPWAKEGFYYSKRVRPGRHPLHEAGLYYIQEPSAMAPIELLDILNDDRVLDLCAAPGGKSTQAAVRLHGRGFLVSNEIHPARAKILSQNIERLGIGNAVVTNESPDKLSKHFTEFFDKILVDAPCSGEGMFRKDETARNQWSPDHVVLCAARQQQILDKAAAMLKPGGKMVYSTCTFSPEENEGSIHHFLNRHPEFSIEQGQNLPGLSKGRPEWAEDGRKELCETFRIWPHHTEGEGHYMAVLKKEGGEISGKWKEPAFVKDKDIIKCFDSFVKDTLNLWGKSEESQRLLLFGGQLYLFPEGMPSLDGIKTVRPGLHLGTLKKNRLEPAHALAMSLNKNQARQWCSMTADSDAIRRYYHGEALPVSRFNPSDCQLMDKGWVLMMVDSWPAGWAKLSGGILKNHYPKGLRCFLPE